MYGLSSGSAGGFIGTGYYTMDEAESAMAGMIEAEEVDDWDVEVLEVCDLHAEQPADGCEECA